MKIILTKKEADERLLKVYNLPKETEVIIEETEPVTKMFTTGFAVAEKTPKQFYKELFNIDVENPPKAKEGYIALPIPYSLTCNEIYKVMKTKFNCYSYIDDIDGNITTQQERPQKDYTITYKDTIECDEEHRNKSYNDFCNDGNKYMVVKEGMLAYLYKFWLTGEMFDVKGVTYFHALDSADCVLSIRRHDDGRFRLGWSNRGNRMSDCGPREVNF